MTALSVVLTPSTHQSAPSHSDAHNKLHAWYNASVPNGAPAPAGVLVSAGTATLPSVFQVFEGAPGALVSDHAAATVYISRDAAMTVVDDSNGALWVVHRNNGATQPVAGQFYAQNIGAGDSASVYARSGAGTGRAYGYFGLVSFTGNGGVGAPGAIWGNAYMINASGAHATWDGSGGTPFMAALFIQANQATWRNGVGVLAGDGIALQYGVGLKPGSVIQAGWRDDSNATKGMIINGTRTTGVEVNSIATNAFDASGAVLSGYHYKMDANSGLAFVAGDPSLLFEGDTWITVTRADHLFRFYVSGTARFFVGASGATVSGYYEGAEQTTPAAPAADGYRIFAKDNGSGKTQLMVIFSSGAAQQLAIQP